MTATAPDPLTRLADADARRDGTPPDRARVAATYAELADAIDPSTTAGAARVEWILDRGCVPEPPFETLLRRAAAHGRTPHLRWIAAGSLYTFDVARGDLRGAEERLKGLVREMTAAGAPESCAVASNLADVYLGQGREFEVLVTARRAVRIAREHDVSGVLGIALGKVAWALMELEDWRAAAVVAADIERIVPDLDESHVPHALRLVHRVRATRALAHGWTAAARDEIRAFCALDAVADPLPSDRAYAVLLAARAALASSRAREAESQAARLLTAPGCTRTMRVRAGAIRIHALVALDDAAGAVEAAESLRPVLVEGVRTGALVGTSLRATAEIARLLDPHPCALGFVEIASEALFARMAQLEACVEGLGGISDQPAEDLARLADYRTRFVEQHQALLTRIARHHDRSGTPAPPVLSSLVGEGHLRVCAWCLSVRTDDGRDLPLGHLLPHVAGVRVSHGMCDPCLARVTA